MLNQHCRGTEQADEFLNACSNFVSCEPVNYLVETPDNFFLGLNSKVMNFPADKYIYCYV